MESFFFVIMFLIIIICGIAVLYVITYNKFQDVIIRINEVESTIDNSLRTKYDLLNRSISIIKGNTKITENCFEEIIKLRSRKINNFELNRILIESYNEFLTLTNKYKELKDSEEITKIDNNIKEIDDNLSTLIEYFNKNITTYNKLVKTFPTNVVATFSKYQERLFFDNKDMSDSDINDFKL